MDTDYTPAMRLAVCQACGGQGAELRSDPNGTEPDLLCEACARQGRRRQEWS